MCAYLITPPPLPPSLLHSLTLCCIKQTTCAILIEFKQKISVVYDPNANTHAHVASEEDESKVPELIIKVRALLKEHGMQERAACFSLEDTSVNKQLTAVPEFNTLVSAMESVKVMLLYYSGILPFVSTQKLCSLYG